MVARTHHHPTRTDFGPLLSLINHHFYSVTALIHYPPPTISGHSPYLMYFPYQLTLDYPRLDNKLVNCYTHNRNDTHPQLASLLK